MRQILAGLIAVLFVAIAYAQENVPLKAGVGRETVENHCAACHSLDYPRINAPFLNHQSWEAEVNKMIKAYGAPIEPSDAKIIIDYLAKNYGTGD
jgi:mono/diheme cytochrome c family protein